MRSNLLANNPNKQILWLYDCPVQDSEMTTDVLWHWRGVTKLMKSKNQSVNEIAADILLLLSILIVKVSLGSIILIRVDKMFCCTLQSPVSSLQCSVLLTFRGCWGASQLPPDIYHIDISCPVSGSPGHVCGPQVSAPPPPQEEGGGAGEPGEGETGAGPAEVWGGAEEEAGGAETEEGEAAHYQSVTQASS